jgi:hypothetical protein
MFRFRIFVLAFVLATLAAPVRPVWASCPPTPASPGSPDERDERRALQSSENCAQPGSSPGTAPAAGGILGTFLNIFQIRFDTLSFTDTVVKMGNKIVQGAYAGAQAVYSRSLDTLVFGDYGLTPGSRDADGLFDHLIRPHWNITFSAALLLLPATLALTAIGTMRLGLSSPIARKELSENLLAWLVALGAAAMSFYLLGLGHRLAASIAASILRSDFGGSVTGATLAGTLFNATSLAALARYPATAPLVLYFGLAALFLGSAVLLGLGLALAAFIGLLYLLTALAPLVLVLGVLPPLRWLYSLWLKGVTLTLLIPVVDSLLLKAAVAMTISGVNAEGVPDLGGFLTSAVIAGSLFSLLIVVNYEVARIVFSGLAEIHRRAWGALAAVGQMALAVAGTAITGASLPAATAAAGGALFPGAGLPGGGNPPVGGNPGGGGFGTSSPVRPATASHAVPARSGNTSALPSTPGGQGAQDDMRRAQLQNALGRTLAASGNPLARGFGQGLMTGGAVNAAEAGSRLSAEQQRAQAERAEDVALSKARGYADRPMPSTPAAVQDLSPSAVPENRALLTGRMFDGHRALGLVTPMERVQPVVDQSYLAWVAQGRPGGRPAQTDFWQVVQNTDNYQSAGDFVGAFQAHSQAHGWSLPENFSAAVTDMFAQRKPM